MGLLYDLSSKYKTISIVGMAKNAGKTTALNYLIEEAMDEIPPTGPLSTHIMDGLIDSNKVQQVMGERAVSKARQGNDRTGEVDQA